MFRHLGRFALLALCLFALVIAMGSCGDDDPPPPPIEPLPKEKTFKEQLVESSWRPVSNASGDAIDDVAQEVAELLTLELGIPLTGRVSQNSLRFQTSGKVNWTYGVNISSDDPGDAGEIVYTYAIKGSYWIIEDFGSSATMTLSLTEVDAQGKVRVDGEEADLDLDVSAPGDVLDEERASINGNQLRLGKMIAERID